MKQYSAAIVTVAFWFAMTGVAPARAQLVQSFEQLQVLVRPGDTVEVIGTDGSATKGKIESLSAATLRLTTRGKTREYAQRDTIEIKQKRADSLANGAKIGALTGAAFGAAVGFAALGCENCNRVGLGITAIAVYGGIGAGVGVGIDAMFTHLQTIYRPAPASALARIRVAPVVARGQKSVAMRFSF